MPEISENGYTKNDYYIAGCCISYKLCSWENGKSHKCLWDTYNPNRYLVGILVAIGMSLPITALFLV